MGAEEKGPLPSSDRDGRIYHLFVSVPKLTHNLVNSRPSYPGTAKKCTKKRDAH